MNENERLSKGGFAKLYLTKCDEKSKSDEEIDIQVYTKLLKLDSKLGTTASEQLFWCLFYSLRLDLIKVLTPSRFLRSETFYLR